MYKRQAVGSRIEFVDIYAHDAYLAMVSHMPHLLASILTQVSGGDELGELRMKLSAGEMCIRDRFILTSKRMEY